MSMHIHGDPVPRTAAPHEPSPATCERGTCSTGFCSPCVIVWGAFLLYIAVSTLIRAFQ